MQWKHDIYIHIYIYVCVCVRSSRIICIFLKSLLNRVTMVVGNTLVSKKTQDTRLSIEIHIASILYCPMLHKNVCPISTAQIIFVVTKDPNSPYCDRLINDLPQFIWKLADPKYLLSVVFNLWTKLMGRYLAYAWCRQLTCVEIDSQLVEHRFIRCLKL